MDSRKASEGRRLDSRSYEEQRLESRAIAGKDRQYFIWASQELHLNSRKARALQRRLSLPGDGLDFNTMFKRQSAEVSDDVDEKKLLHDTYLHIPGQKTRTDEVLVQKIPYHFVMTDFTSEFSDNENSYKQERSVGDILMKGLWTGLATLALYHTRQASASKLAVC
ncbi:uncharacterized protein LOC125043995 [Penaeus chinensis]|uniref:uncharacterized protein LOC125043995 n=1 Tax=Penaeus chinensis TaxID=139456 RepID=UPI001FB5DFEC|nr:uncharacterized protein LOC125043995 [Penaeus chinensis]